MPLFVGDYLADTQHLTIEQSGAYLHLIMTYWTRGKALPSNDRFLATVCRMNGQQWQNARPLLAEFFDTDSDPALWVHGRVEEELEKAISYREKMSVRGKKGAAVKWKK